MRKQIEQMNKQSGEGLHGLNYAGLQSSKQLHHRYYKDKPIGEMARRQKRVCTHLVKTSPGKAAPSHTPHRTPGGGGKNQNSRKKLDGGFDHPHPTQHVIIPLQPAQFCFHLLTLLSLHLANSFSGFF